MRPSTRRDDLAMHDFYACDAYFGLTWGYDGHSVRNRTVTGRCRSAYDRALLHAVWQSPEP